MTNSLLKKQIEVFFFNPQNSIQPPNDYGVLYLLRRDIYRCLGYNTVTWSIDRESIIWPGAMTVLAGIDLLGKFYKGDDSIKGVGQRFKDYYDEYIDNQHSEIIYQLRNSLLHSFGLSSKTKTKTYSFTVSASRDRLVEQYSETSYKIDLYSLWDRFEESIEKYKNDLQSNDLLKTKFEKMFKFYGAVRIE